MRVVKNYMATENGKGYYYTMQPMGQHILRKFTFKVAELLKLDNLIQTTRFTDLLQMYRQKLVRSTIDTV